MDSFNNNSSLVSEELLSKETIEQKFYGLTVILKVLNLHYLFPLLLYSIAPINDKLLSNE